jgi:hypothetical protein
MDQGDAGLLLIGRYDEPVEVEHLCGEPFLGE